MFTLTLVGFGVGERLRRLGEALRDRRPPLVELLLDLRPPLGEGLLDLLPPLPLELERLLLRLEVERLLDRDLERDRDLRLNFKNPITLYKTTRNPSSKIEEYVSI